MRLIDEQQSVSALRYAALLTGNRDDAEDLLQEAHARLLREQAGGRHIEHPASYLRRIVTTVFLNGRRREALWRRTMPRLAAEEVARFDDRVSERNRLGRALHRLPQRQRAAVVLRYYEDLAYADIAAALGCGEATARSLVNRGIRGLRLTIDLDEDDR